MQIKEIDGKKYVLYEQDKENKKKMINSTIFLVLMVVAIVALLYATTTLIKNKDLIGQDPITYGMKAHGFISCQCFDETGTEWYSAGEGFVSQRLAGYSINVGGGG